MLRTISLSLALKSRTLLPIYPRPFSSRGPLPNFNEESQKILHNHNTDTNRRLNEMEDRINKKIERAIDEIQLSGLGVMLVVCVVGAVLK